MFKKLVHWWDKYERRLMFVGLITGFVFDLFIAKSPDSVADNLLLLSYIVIAGGLILILNLRTVRQEEAGVSAPPLVLLFILQFCFGGLSSNLLVLYGKSGTFADSTLFLLLLAGMLVGNEFLKTRYQQLRFNIVVYYLLVLTYAVIAVPTFIAHSVGTLVFLLSGFISLVYIALFLWLIYRLVLRGRNREAHLQEVSVLVGLVFLFFNGLYFLNIIPPVPLSLKGIGVYHSIERLVAPKGSSASIYAATYEPAPWFVFWRDTSGTFTLNNSSGEAACFSSVYAPGLLSAPIYHQWEKYSESTGGWVEQTRVSFGISGGREEGYRGFTTTTVTPGKWRCNVETQNGALIGRISFTVVGGSGTPELSQTRL